MTGRRPQAGSPEMADDAGDAATVHVVTHTHWDREWYRTATAFGARLVELVAAVADQLDDGRLPHVLLDGQTIVLDDVAAVRPDLIDRLSGHARAGRLTVGPWHVLADTTLVDAESLARNLLAGRRWTAALGGGSQVAYAPDLFGFPADLPTVLAGFGFTTTIVWRGAPPQPSRFRWRAPDGSEVVALRACYYNPEVLWDVEAAPERLADWLAAARAREDGPWLLLDGGDHLAPRDIRRRLARLGDPPTVDGAAVRATTLADHAAAVRATHPPQDLPSSTGELRVPGRDGAFLLAGTLSTRMPVKQAAARTATTLQRWAEPWVAWASRAEEPCRAAADGQADDQTLRALLDRAWGHLLACHPHDSICGCSTDAVDADVRGRLEDAEELAEHVTARALRRVGVDTRPARAPSASTAHLVVTNPHGTPLDDGVTATLALPEGRAPVAVHDAGGSPVPFSAEPLGPARADLVTDVDQLPAWPAVQRWRMALLARDVPACGWLAYEVALGDRVPEEGRHARTDASVADLGAWQLTARDDAGVDLRDAEDRDWPGLGRLLSHADAGDTYTMEPVDDVVAGAELGGAERVRSAVWSGLALHARLHPPGGAARRRGATDAGEVAARMAVGAWLGGPGRLEWDVALRHHARDHRLRWAASAPAARGWVSDATLALVQRPLTPPDLPIAEDARGEADPRTAPAQRVAAVGRGADRLAALCAGLPEVSGVDRGGHAELAVTLLRAVGQLGHHDLRARPMGAGPPVPTPGAQQDGDHRFSLAVRLGDDDATLLRHGERWRAPLRAWQTTAPPPQLRRGFLAVEGPALLSALKPAEDGDEIVVRLADPAGVGGATTLRLPEPPAAAAAVDLAEEHPRALPLEGGVLRVTVPPFGLRTVRLRW